MLRSHRTKVLFLAMTLAVSASCTEAKKQEAPKAPAAASTGGGQSASPAGRIPVKLEGKTMGTTYHITMVVPDEETARRAERVKVDIDRALEVVNNQMSTYRPHSELSMFNGQKAEAPFPVSPATAKVVKRSLEIGALTDGAFDVTLGPLIDLWGFDKNGRRTEPPSPEDIAREKARVGLDRIRVENDTLTKTRDDVEVNLSGIAKGYGVDVVYDLLSRRRLRDFMIEIGGEVRVRGLNPKGVAWTLGVNVPKSDADPTAVLRAVPLSGGAMATSGNYRNFFEAGGKRYGHIIDPRTAAPVTHDLVSATIIAHDCTTADALATAALVLGEEKMREVLKGIPGTSAMFVHAAEGVNGELKVSATEGFPPSR